MAIRAYGKLFSWENTLFYPGWEDDGDDGQYARILAHAQPSVHQYRSPTTQAEKDFSESPGIYLLHGKNEDVVYVGQAQKLLLRLNAHTGDHLRGRWTHYSWYALDDGVPWAEAKEKPKRIQKSEWEEGEVEKAPNETVSLDVVEAILRTSIEPKLNLQGGRWGDAKCYAQSLEYDFVYLRENYELLRKINRRTKSIRKTVKGKE